MKMKELTQGWEEETLGRKIKTEKEMVKGGLGIGRGIIKKRANKRENKTDKRHGRRKNGEKNA